MAPVDPQNLELVAADVYSDDADKHPKRKTRKIVATLCAMMAVAGIAAGSFFVGFDSHHVDSPPVGAHLRNKHLCAPGHLTVHDHAVPCCILSCGCPSPRSHSLGEWLQQV